MNRKSFAKSVETEILIKCRRRCALCFGLEGDAAKKSGQLAHVDRDPANASKENVAFLCTSHHDEYDSVSKQTKRPPRSRTRDKATGISLDLYARRLPTYKTTIQFLRVVLKDLKPDLHDLFKFAADTDEALFLFDETIANYLAHLFKQALRLRAVSLMLNKEWKASLEEEEMQLSTWFTEQLEETRRKFTPFLQVTS
jgi:hypothetical protein